MVTSAILSAALAACGRGVGDIGQGHPPDPSAAERAYRAPPSVLTATPLAGGRMLLVGRADPGAQVRFSTPNGETGVARADAGGRWRFALGPAPVVRLFGLAMIEGRRILQAQGYLAIIPRGWAAQLRAGAGARVFAAGGILRLLAVDYDRKGGTVVSGTARPGQSISVRIDGLQKGVTAAGAAGRFTLALDEPLSAGHHRIDVGAAPAWVGADISVSPAAPLIRAPFAASLVPSGWRVDWMTPGGGVQTTLLIGPPQVGVAQSRP